MSDHKLVEIIEDFSTRTTMRTKGTTAFPIVIDLIEEMDTYPKERHLKDGIMDFLREWAEDVHCIKKSVHTKDIIHLATYIHKLRRER